MVLFASCKKETDPPKNPVAVQVKSVRLLQIPNQDPACNCAWDLPSGAPDIWMALSNPQGTLEGSSNTLTDNSSYPILWTFPANYQITNLNGVYNFYVFDEDSPSNDDLIGELPFKANDYSSFPPTIILEKSFSTGKTRLQLEVTWIY